MPIEGGGQLMKKVVVIDDKSVVRNMIIRTFDWENLNCKVVGEATDGAQGQRMISNMQPDLLITDIRLAGRDGFALAEWMRTHLPCAKTILTTDYRNFDYARQAIRLKVHAYIIKPLQQAELSNAVQTALDELDQCPAAAHAAKQANGNETRGSGPIMSELEQFNIMIERASTGQMIDYLEGFIMRVKQYSCGSEIVWRGLISKAAMSIAEHYFKVTRDEYGMGLSLYQLLDDIDRLRSLEEAYAYLSSLITAIKQKLSGEGKHYTPLVKQIIDYINSQYSRNINLASVADHFGLSQSYVSRILRADTGVHFTDLVSRTRIEVAKQLLQNAKYKLNEVGDLVGFKNYAYFYHVFKRIEGVSPKEFKNSSHLNSAGTSLTNLGWKEQDQ
ncbi:response regulator [Paenibacillaceae bacterium]|nr:response regulator [Paenibacillaceae bacterium]